MKKKSRAVVEDETLSSTDRFIARYKNYSNYYVLLLSIVGVSVATAIVIALFENVLLGMVLAIFAYAVYALCSKGEARKQLGINASHEKGRITVNKVEACYGEEFVVPQKFEFSIVSKIADRAFDSKKNDGVRVIYLPVSITYIGESIFGEEGPLPEIRFEGTEAQWRNIEIHTGLSDAVIFFNVPYPLPPRKEKVKKQESELK